MGMPRITMQLVRVIDVLLAAPSRVHYGLEIIKASGLPSGTIYPILMRLEQLGWVESSWEEIDTSKEGRRPRRYYRLTALGATSSEAVLEQWEEASSRTNKHRRLAPQVDPV